MPILTDLTGQKFGRLTVISRVKRDLGSWWLCRCECGTEKVVAASSLKAGHSKSCGCYRDDKLKARREDVTGQRFGRLVAESYEGTYANGGNSRWKFKCDCGNTCIACLANVKRGSIQSCGCLRVGAKKTHGFSKTGNQVYRCWKNIKTRCTNEKSEVYKYYGGRGISICQEWANDFMAFYNYVGNPPSTGMSLDRIDPNGNYEPGNVRWATPAVQSMNQRDRRNVTYHGNAVSLDQLCLILDIDYSEAYDLIVNKSKNVDETVRELQSRQKSLPVLDAPGKLGDDTDNLV